MRPQLSQWNYIDYKSNPADDATRGQSADKFIINKRWLNRLDILWKKRQEQRDQFAGFEEGCPLPLDDPEVKRTHTVNATCTKEENATQRLMTHFSDWTKLRLAVAWYLKLKETLKNTGAKKENKWEYNSHKNQDESLT